MCGHKLDISPSAKAYFSSPFDDYHFESFTVLPTFLLFGSAQCLACVKLPLNDMLHNQAQQSDNEKLKRLFIMCAFYSFTRYRFPNSQTMCLMHQFSGARHHLIVNYIAELLICLFNRLQPLFGGNMPETNANGDRILYMNSQMFSNNKIIYLYLVSFPPWRRRI